MSKKSKILVADDNEYILSSLQVLLKPEFGEVITLKNPNLIPSVLEKELVDVILLDMNFSAGLNTGNEGIYWLKEILKKDPEAVVIMITAYGDIELAVKAIRDGATDFIQKPWDPDKLITTIGTACKLRQTGKLLRNAEMKHRALSMEADKAYRMIAGPSRMIKEVVETINKVAPTDANILIVGESGTGKEVIARELHRKSHRCNEIFAGVDLGAISETLFESELFGHVKGAFTDAVTERAGRFEIATGGTLFLDEIGNLPLHMQPKLLTTLERREIIPVGSARPVPIDIRLISATNSDIDRLTGEKGFREDLFYRINTITIRVPALRERKEDIPALTGHFVAVYAAKYRREGLAISDGAIEKLTRYSWPGNIRELIHAIEKAVILTENSVIQPSDINLTATRHKSVTAESLNLQEVEKEAIVRAVEKHKGNMSLSARELGITRATLYSKLRKYEL